MIVAYPAGGANDIVARTVGQKMTELLGQPIVVDNRSGAENVIAVASGQIDMYFSSVALLLPLLEVRTSFLRK